MDSVIYDRTYGHAWNIWNTSSFWVITIGLRRSLESGTEQKVVETESEPSVDIDATPARPSLQSSALQKALEATMILSWDLNLNYLQIFSSCQVLITAVNVLI